MKKIQCKKILCGALCSAAFLGSAAADTVVQVKEISLGNGMNSGSLTLPVQAGAANYWAGFQNITVQNGASTNTFLAFCLDPYQWSSASYSTYTQTTLDTTFSASAIEKLVDLYNYGYSNALSSNLGAAALQLALWEVVNDTGIGNTGLTNGYVQINGGTNLSLVNATNNILSNYSSPNNQSMYNFTFYKSSTNQDFLVASPVPEPETNALMLAGLGLVAAVVRRRKASQRASV